MRYVRGIWLAACFLGAASAAAAQGIDVNTDGRITINADGYIDLNTDGQNLTLGGGTVDIAANAVGSTPQLEIEGNVTINTGTLTSAGVTGTITVRGNWTNKATWNQGSSTVTFSGTGTQSVEKEVGGTTTNQTESFNNITINKSAGTFTTNDSGVGDDGDRLNVTGTLTLTAGTWDTDPDSAQIEHTIGTYTQTGGVLKIDTSGSTGTLSSHMTVTGNFTVSGGTFSAAAATPITMEITVKGNVSISPASGNWLFQGWFRVRGPDVNASADTRGLGIKSGSKIRVLEVWLQESADTFDISSSQTEPQVTCEYVTIQTGILNVGSGGTLTCQDQADSGFTTTGGASGELGRIRFNGNSSHTSRQFLVAGTVNAHEIGADSTGSNDGYWAMTGGTITLTQVGGVKGGVVFQNNDDAGNAGPEIELTGGTINVAGNWTMTDSEAGSVFLFSTGTTGGTVVFNGTGSQTITHVPDAEAITGRGTGFYNVTINNTAVDDSANPVLVDSGSADTTVTIRNTLTLTDGRLKISGSAANVTLSVTAAQTITVPSGSTLDLEPQGARTATLSLLQGSTLSVAGTFEAIRATGATVNSTVNATGGDTSGWSMSVTASGTFDAQYFTFADLSATGVVFAENSTIRRMHECTFTKETSLGGPCIDLSAVTGVNRSRVPHSINGVTFNGSSGNNVKSGIGTPIVTCLGATTGRFGEANDDDIEENDTAFPNDGRVLFESNIIRNVTTGNTYHTVQAAVDAASASDRIRPQKMMVIDGNLDVNVDVILENFTFAPRTGLAVDGGSSLRGSLHNCAIAAGGADYVTLRNCTVFDPIGSPTTTNCTAYNTIFEEAAPSVGPGTNNLTSAAAGTFINASALNFHLAADDNGGTSGAPSGWTGTPSEDMDGHARSGTWDRGCDEFADVSLSAATSNVGRVKKIHFIGGTWRNTTSTNGFAYVGTGAGSTTAANNNTLYVIDVTDMSIKAQVQAAGPILHLQPWTDNRGVPAATDWRTWIYCVVDSNSDGYGDCIQVFVDYYDSVATTWKLENPTADVSDSTPTNRKFGDATVGAHRVYQPWTPATDYRILWCTVATVNPDGNVDGSVVYNSPAGANRCRWLRLFFCAEKTTATTGGSFFKLNADPYDQNDNGAANNRWFGRTIYAVVPSADADLNDEPGEDIDSTTDWNNFEHRSWLLFTYDASYLKIFPSISNTTDGLQSILHRWNMAGTGNPAVDNTWRGTEATGVPVVRFGITLDNGNTGATAICSAEYSTQTIIYSRFVSSSAGSSYLRWACRLKDGSGTDAKAVGSTQRYWGTSFALVPIQDAIQKIWCQNQQITYLEAATTGGEVTLTVASGTTSAFPSSGTIYVGERAIAYTGTTSTQFTGCSNVGAHPIGAPIIRDGHRRNGCLVSDGKKLDLGTSTAGDELTLDGSGGTPDATDPDWPLSITGKAIYKIIFTSGSKIFFATDKGYFYSYTVNLSGSSVAGGDETLRTGYPIVFPGHGITAMHNTPGGMFLSGSTDGQIIRTGN